MTKPLLLLTLSFLLAGCTVGPDFHAPPPPTVQGYAPQPPKPAADAQAFVENQDIPADWWTIFHAPALDALIRQALKANPDLKSAQAALKIAMEDVKAQMGAYYPSIGAGLGAGRNKDAAELSPTLASSVLLYNLYRAQLSVSWAPDIWGANRRQVETLKAVEDAQRFALRATYVAIAANIVAAAIQEASLNDQIATTQAMIADARRILDIERRRQALGEISGADVAQRETALAQAEQMLPPLEKQLAQQRDLLTALVRRLPSDAVTENFTLADLHLPRDLPLSLPSRLVRQRPDIRIAEENLHAASAQIGVAIADMLPNITLGADDGTVATRLGQLLAPGNGFWSLGAELTQPVFDGGMMLHHVSAARDAYDQAAAQYRSAIIAAFQNVADTLHAIETDTRAFDAARDAEAAAAKNYAIARAQVAEGQTGRLALLDTGQSYQQARIALMQAEAGRLSDTAALFQALGGGWWNTAGLQEKQPRPQFTVSKQD